ncbi:antitoxin Xre/MbcA/ParS toxin-binding domain-containing protein [Flavobacterium sp. ZS1P14]|uniref:antitoxin Xre/MbcA/ParS toxin-binding domain-containing protein n=1 Tax=Flavobacterium sp. ZS1P14 TaxID=3401729 RepID=UPI003AAC0F1C
MTTLQRAKKTVKFEIPEIGNPRAVRFFLEGNTIGSIYFNALKAVSTLNDSVVSDWLHISTKTYQTYRKEGILSKENTQEHVVLLLALYQHGEEVFETSENFDKWLISPNFYLYNKAPKDYLGTITGIKIIDDRLTAIEFGDNI